MVRTIAIGLIAALGIGIGNLASSAPTTTLLCKFVCMSITDGKKCSKETIKVTYVLPTRKPFPKGKKPRTFKLPGNQKTTQKANGLVDISFMSSTLFLLADGTAGRATLYVLNSTEVTIRTDSGSCTKVATE